MRTVILCLMAIACIAVLLALLLPEAQWVADGHRDIPIEVFVFDVNTGRPIPDAEVTAFSCPGYYSVDGVQDVARQMQGWIEHTKEKSPERSGRTNSQGIITLPNTFSTGSSNRHPQPRVFPSKCWVFVSAPGFRGVSVSLGTYAVDAADVKQRGGFLVPVGISTGP